MNKTAIKKTLAISALVAVSVLASTYLSLWGSDLLSSIYGENRPSNRVELCEFLDEKLADKKLTDERLIKRYSTDKEMHCKEEDLKAAERGEPPSGAALTFFLRQARSGAEVLSNSNNLLDILLPDRHKPKVNPATVAKAALKALEAAL